VLNQVGPGPDGAQRGFGTETNAATVLDREQVLARLGPDSKDAIADAIWDLVTARLPDR
jgi:phosphopantothenoylcysteine decarboxylase / phosphopantothenate---cysteine ligase